MIQIKTNRRTKASLIHLNNTSLFFRRGIKNGLHEIGRDNQLYLRKIIRDKNKTGRLYKVRGKLHRASAPGEAPAYLSGKLSRSVDYTVTGTIQMEFGDKALHGKFLEDGTTRMAARPHVGRTVRARSGVTRRTLERTVYNEVK